MNFNDLSVPPGQVVKLKNYPTDSIAEFADKDKAGEKLEADIAKLADWQAKLAAQDMYGLLVILQGMDAAGKDSTIKHVMSGVNPSGCQVHSFKTPSDEELDHDYLWRHVKALPERGVIGIFNRSYYEEVVIVRVHPKLLEREKIPAAKKGDKLWARRFEEINHFERYLVDNGFEILKFFLHLSKQEQKKRFLARLEMADKNWKFTDADVAEREYWDAYQAAYEAVLSNTSTTHAPWHVIPADHKWFSRLAVAHLIVQKLASLGLRYPEVEGAQKKALANAKKILDGEH